MDASSVVSSLNASLEFHKPPAMVLTTTTTTNNKRSKWVDSNTNNGGGGRRQGYDVCQRSDTGTDLSTERPSTRDTNTLFMRDASILSGQPDKSNFREKMQNWAMYDEETSSTYVAPRPTTSFASQKPGCRGTIMEDIEREMSFLMSRPSTSFPTKPKELIEPLEGLLPDERPVSQKKFFVLPSIGGTHHHHHHHHHHHGEFFLRRQRSNIESTNQLDYSRSKLEHEANFFADYYNNHNHHHRQYYDHDDDDDGNDSPQSLRNPRESPSKGKTGTPMPLPPIHHKLKWEKRSRPGPAASLAGLEEEFSRELSLISSGSSAGDGDEDDEDDDDDEEDPDFFRMKTPCSPRSSFSNAHVPIPPPPGFR